MRTSEMPKRYLLFIETTSLESSTSAFSIEEEAVSQIMEDMEIENSGPQEDYGDPGEAYSQHSFH